MPRYTDASIERVREAVDMVDLVGSRTELRRAGSNRLQGLCPFHEERTPSFGIDPVRKLYHCFGCGAGGDAIDFVRETENVSFVEAIELLADRYRVTLEQAEEDPREAQRRQRQQRLLELLERTATYYARLLWEAAEAEPARRYLVDERGLREEVLREFRVGWAPDAWDRVLSASRRAGFTDEELLAAGLVQRNERGRVYDRFRGRITFPLADLRGRVRGFGARQMVGSDRGPKYLNTAESELFHKGRQLFAADLARAHAAKAGSVIVAEGYTDVVALHQAGLRNAVAVMGTAMTADQLRELGRMAPVVHLALDADSAGQEAMVRAAGVAGGMKVELRVVPLPPGSDPADLALEGGAEALEALVARSMPFVRFRVQRALETGDLSSAEGKDRILDELRPLFAAIPPSVQREELQRLVADRLDLAPELAGTLLGQTPRRRAAPEPGRAAGEGSGAGPTGALSRAEEAERAFLAHCVALPDAGRAALEGAEELLAADSSRRAARHLRDHLDRPTEGLEDDEELLGLMREIAVRAAELEPRRSQLEIERTQLEWALLQRRIASLRAAGDTGVADLAAQLHRVDERLQDLIARAVEAEA